MAAASLQQAVSINPTLSKRNVMSLTNYLRIPLSMAERMADIESFDGLPPENLAVLPRDYSEQEIQSITDALKFAAEHPEFDFAALLPDMPHSNAQLHAFLVKMHKSIQGWHDTRTATP